MSESLPDLLAKGADRVDRPQLDVDDLITTAQRRLGRRRLAVVAASAATLAAIAAGGLALQTDGQNSPPPRPTDSRTPDVKPGAEPGIYFDALAVEGDRLTDRIRSVDGPKDIYEIRPGGPAQRVIGTVADEHCPQVSPDGDRLAYLEGSRTVVVRRLGSTGDPVAVPLRVTLTADQGVTCPQWSPDGRQLAVGVQTYQAPDQVLEVRVIGIDGNQRSLATRRARYMPLPDVAWSPDGAAIAFTTPESVWVAPLDGAEPRMAWRGRAALDPARAGFPPYPGMPTRLSWLATGELAVSTQTEVDGDEAVHLVDPASGHDQLLGTFPTSEPTWSWSPDGSQLVFPDSDGGARLLDLASGRAEPLDPRLGGRRISIWGLTWSPDGRRLVGTASDGDPATTKFALVSMDPDGSSVKVLTPWVMALYSVSGVSWSSR